ncbi:hypothetical protein [Longirhabdus pacifica]|uniref:hypothetical protein n=1 Tax=Longirhabdus pacifica TaxID=2305227 RepID=UPI001008B309|nr:hypothetical protein [Longirhabdus pacifica]
MNKVYEAIEKKGWEKGIARGIEKGMEKGILKTAENMLKEDVDINVIKKVTGLSEKAIMNLKK